MAADLGNGETGAKPGDGTTRAQSATSGPSSTTDSPYAAIVQVRADAKSEFAGQTLRVVKIERGYGGKRTFLCEMPGYPHPGYFGEKEVEFVQHDA